MRVVYTTHVRLRMRQRGVSARAIEAAIRSPDRISSGFGGRAIVGKAWGAKTVEVVYRALPDRLVVITAYWADEGD